MNVIENTFSTPEKKFDWSEEKKKIQENIFKAKMSQTTPPHLQPPDKFLKALDGRPLPDNEANELRRFDNYVRRMFDAGDWDVVILLIRERLNRYPPAYDSYKMLIQSSEKAGSLNLAAEHAREAYTWDPLLCESYLTMAKLDLMALNPERSVEWLEIVEMVPTYKQECGRQYEAVKLRINDLRLEIETLIAKVTPLFCLPDFWVKLSSNAEYYRSFACDETRKLVSMIHKDPTYLRQCLNNDKIFWLASMLNWTSAALTYEPPSESDLEVIRKNKHGASLTSGFMSLPSEVLVLVMDHLDPPSLGRLTQVSLYWRDLLTKDHVIWKRLYLNIWDPPLIYHVPDWLWIHAYRQRYGLCVFLSRLWNRRKGEYAIDRPDFFTKTTQMLSRFSFISPSFSDCLSLIPDFIFGSVNHNFETVAKNIISEVETSEPWPEFPSFDTLASPSSSPSTLTKPKSLQFEVIEEPHPYDGPKDFITQYLGGGIGQRRTESPHPDTLRRTKNKATAVMTIDPHLPFSDSAVVNVCYYILCKAPYGQETVQAMHALSAMSFHHPPLAHYLIQRGALERLSLFTAIHRYHPSWEAEDLLATLLLHKHGIAMEASDSPQTACKIYPRIWSLGLAQDLKDLMNWVHKLSGVWRGRFFIGIPGFDTPYTEHFLFLKFHVAINFGTPSPPDASDILAEFKQMNKPVPAFRFTSQGYTHPNPNHAQKSEWDQEQYEIPEVDLQMGDCPISGWGIDDFGPYRITGSLNVVYKSVFLEKIYEFEPQDSHTTLTGDLGIWGMGGFLGSETNKNGVWKMWKDGTHYSLEDMQEMLFEANHQLIKSVQFRRHRHYLRQRLCSECLGPHINPNYDFNLDNPLPHTLVQKVGEPLDGVPENVELDYNYPVECHPRKGLRWSEISTMLADTLVDPLPPLPGPDIEKYTGIRSRRGSYPGLLSAKLLAENHSDWLAWYDVELDCGPLLTPIHSKDDEQRRKELLKQRPCAAQFPGSTADTHASLLWTIIELTGVMFKLEHVIDESAPALESEDHPIALHATPPIKRFRGESDVAYVNRRTVFATLWCILASQRHNLLLLHKDIAARDAEILKDQTADWNHPLKLAITHRWIDVWWRHPVRFAIPEEKKLQEMLAEVLANPTYGPLGPFYEECKNQETEFTLQEKVANNVPLQSSPGEYESEEEESEESDDDDNEIRRSLEHDYTQGANSLALQTPSSSAAAQDHINDAASSHNSRYGWFGYIAVIAIGVIIAVGANFGLSKKS